MPNVQDRTTMAPSSRANRHTSPTLTGAPMIFTMKSDKMPNVIHAAQPRSSPGITSSMQSAPAANKAMPTVADTPNNQRTSPSPRRENRRAIRKNAK